MAETKRFTRAPHLGRRRLVRAYFLPWVQIPAGLIFVVLSYNLPTERFYLFVWFLLFSLCVIVQDMVRPYSRVIRFWYWLFGEKLCWSRWQFTPDVDKLEQYNPHPAPPLWQYRYQMGWVAAVVSLLLIWGAALVQSQLSVTDTAEIVSQTLLVCGLLAFGIVPYGLITARLMSHLSRNIRLIIWLVLALVIGGPIIAVSLYWLTGDLTSTILVTLLFFLLYTAVFVNQRIWVGRQAIGEVVQEVSRTFLSWPETSQKIDTVPELIGERLRHDRVFVLTITPDDPEHLVVKGQFGDYPDVIGQRIPVNQSLTGKALGRRLPVVWNDVSRCPYYHSAHDDDDTSAEIAVPMVYNGVVYGILDVQSRRRNVYGPGDVILLEIVARILGTTLAVDQRDYFFDKAVVLLEKIGRELPRRHQSEVDLLEPLATFAQNILGVDQMVYFPLSLTGVPVSQPYVYRQSSQVENIEKSPPTYQYPHAALVRLIIEWQPLFPQTDAEIASIQQALWPTDVLRQEEICTTCFIPVGLAQEPLGVLFLNFYTPKRFDTRFKFTVLSLAQSLAKIASQLRYRQVLIDGIGRPELGLHDMIGRQGLKEGVTHIAHALHTRCHTDCCQDLSDCVYNDLFATVDVFLQQVSMAESSIPPNFWRNDFLERLQHHINDRPSRPDGRRPDIMTDHIDPSIERENPWVKLTLYRLVTEAINNAIFHGHATKIWITIKRHRDKIEVEVLNSGQPLPPDAQENHSEHGIYSLLDECRYKLGAITDINVGPSGNGTRVFLAFPTLPAQIRTFDVDDFASS